MRRKTSRQTKQAESSYSRLEPAFRQRQLIEATTQVIARFGISSVTLQRVAEAADVTAGMVNFHFKSKDALLKATLEALVDDYTENLSSAVEAADGPVARLGAIIDQHFAAASMTLDKIAVWYAFWGETHVRQGYQQTCSRADRFLSELVVGLMQQLQPGSPDATLLRAIAAGFIGLIGALSHDIMIDPAGPDRAEAIEICHAYLAFAFPGHRFSMPSPDVPPTRLRADQLAANTPVSADWVAATLRDIDLNLARGLALQDICLRQRLDLKMVNFLRQKYHGMSSDQIRYVMGLENRNRQLTEALAGRLLDQATGKDGKAG
ncbi:MAG: TetR family transcriptional regulator [Dongiaceae bacterium]